MMHNSQLGALNYEESVAQPLTLADPPHYKMAETKTIAFLVQKTCTHTNGFC